MITLSDLDKRKVLKQEIQSNFTAVEDALPLTQEVYGDNCVDLRTLADVKVALQATFGYPDEYTTVLDSTGTYNIVEQSILEHVCTDTDILNKGESGGSVIHIQAYVWAIYDRFTASGCSNIHIATFDGTQWDVLASTKRFVGYGCGKTSRVYTNNLEATDYMDVVTDFVRGNMPWDHPVGLVAALGGDVKSGISNGRTKYAIAIDNALGTSGIGRFFGVIHLNARQT